MKFSFAPHTAGGFVFHIYFHAYYHLLFIQTQVSCRLREYRPVTFCIRPAAERSIYPSGWSANLIRKQKSFGFTVPYSIWRKKQEFLMPLPSCYRSA